MAESVTKLHDIACARAVPAVSRTSRTTAVYLPEASASTSWKNDPRARELTSSVGNSIIRGDTFVRS